MKNKEYFSSIEKEYHEASQYSDELYQNIAAKLEGLLSGRMIDFGNGGIINYNTQKLKKLICIDIINEKKEITNDKIDFIYGDFYNISLKTKVDVVLAQLLLHHLTDDKKIRISIREVKNILKKKGKIIIVEVELNELTERIQNILKPLISKILTRMKKPDLRFFSAKSLLKLLEDSGFNDLRIQRIPIGKKVSPAPVIFPKLRMPGKLYPFRFMLIEATSYSD